MGDGDKAPLQLPFNSKTRLEFQDATIKSDAGLLALREFDDALELTGIANDYLQHGRALVLLQQLNQSLAHVISKHLTDTYGTALNHKTIPPPNL